MRQTRPVLIKGHTRLTWNFPCPSIPSGICPDSRHTRPSDEERVSQNTYRPFGVEHMVEQCIGLLSSTEGHTFKGENSRRISLC
jgi:hypothetical protein